MRAAILLILIVFGIGSSAAQVSHEQVVWTDSTRDVYINGELDRAAQVLTSEETQRIALISPKLDLAVLLNLSDHTINTTSKGAFRFAADRASALSGAAFAVQPAGGYTPLNDSDYSFALDGKPVLIKAHQGLIGETDNQKLFETVPVWRFLIENYQPDRDSIAALKACQRETFITVALATWCSDSKQHVPRLLKSLETAENNHLHIRLVGVGRNFREPSEMIKQLRVVHVPTVIVERNGVELGRIVENPNAKTIEENLAAIVNATDQHQ